MAPTGTFVMDPLVARSLIDEGFKTKEELRKFLRKNRLPTLCHQLYGGRRPD